MITGHLLKIYDAPFFSVVCFDAKINFDDNAAFRQKEIFAMDDMAESDPREVEAHKHNLNYIAMDGNIACLGEVLFQSRHFASVPRSVCDFVFCFRPSRKDYRL